MQKNLTWSEIHLDAMRGLAALVVAFGHARGLFLPSITDSAPASDATGTSVIAPSGAHLTIGHQAVMVFFVLSGYLVGGSVLKALAADRWQWSEYLVKRLARLWTVLVPAVLIGLLIDNIGFNFLGQTGSIYAAPAGQQYVTSESIARGVDIWTAIGNIFFLQGIVVPTSGTNIALWSLSNEFWYYVMFPMIVLILQRNVSMGRRIVFGLVSSGIGLMIGGDAAYLFLVWVLGAIVAAVPPRIPSRFVKWVVALGSLIFVTVFLLLKRFNLSLYVSELLLGLLTALLIYAIKCQDTAAKVSLYSRMSRFFSNISYTLYLTHLPFLIFVCAIVNSPWKRWTLSPLSLIAFMAVALTPILWAWILYRLFESRTDAVRRVMKSIVSKLTGLRPVDVAKPR